MCKHPLCIGLLAIAPYVPLCNVRTSSWHHPFHNVWVCCNMKQTFTAFVTSRQYTILLICYQSTIYHPEKLHPNWIAERLCTTPILTRELPSEEQRIFHLFGTPSVFKPLLFTRNELTWINVMTIILIIYRHKYFSTLDNKCHYFLIFINFYPGGEQLWHT
jgi:hypothetical protein